MKTIIEDIRVGLSIIVIQITFIILILIALLILNYTKSKAQDTTNAINIGKNFRFELELAQFGMKAVASMDDNTMAEVQPVFLTGFTFALVYIKANVGLNISPLFYTEGEKIYPMATLGASFNRYKFGVGWNFGKIDGKLKESWKERACVVFSVNPFK